MANQRILLPFNFTAQDEKALDFAARSFSGREDVEMVLFNSYTPIPEIESQQSRVMEKMKGNLSFMTTRIKEQEEALQDARDKLLQQGFAGHQVLAVFKPRKKRDIAAEIVAQAMDLHSTLVILNHKPGKVANFFTGSVWTKVVSTLKDTAVCIVT